MKLIVNVKYIHTIVTFSTHFIALIVREVVCTLFRNLIVQFAIRNSKVIQAMNDTTPNHWSNESQYLLLILGRITLQYIEKPATL